MKELEQRNGREREREEGQRRGQADGQDRDQCLSNGPSLPEWRQERLGVIEMGRVQA